MLDGDYAAIFEESLILPSSPAWLMLSKFDSTNQPITMLLPADEIKDVYDDVELASNIQQPNEWDCPWGRTVLDNVAPSFMLLMEENLWSMKEIGTKLNHWLWRMGINNRLGLLLKNIDESWFGPWICVLRGNPISNQNEELLVPTLMDHLQPLINSDVNPSLVKAILGGSVSLKDAKECISQLISFRGSFGHVGSFYWKDKFGACSASCNLGCKIPDCVVKVLDNDVQVNRGPVIFVLDTNVQMLPWESLPRLRRQEVYRMPSIRSILLNLKRNYQRQKEKEKEVLFGNSYFPKVNPFDTYYLLNPDGNLKVTEANLKPCLEGFKFEVAKTSFYG